MIEKVLFDVRLELLGVSRSRSGGSSGNKEMPRRSGKHERRVMMR